MTFSFYSPPQIAREPGLLKRALDSYEGITKAQYLKPNLQEALTKQQLYNKYYGKRQESDMALQGAQAGHLGAQTRGINITNESLPEKLRLENDRSRFLANNPLLSQTGPAGQIGSLLYLQQHPEVMQQGIRNNTIEQQDNSYMQPMNGQQPQLSAQTMNPMEMMRQSILKSFNPQAKTFSPSTIGKLQQEKRDIEAGFLPNTNRTQKFESKEAQEEAVAPYDARLGGLKEDQRFVKNEEGKKIGIQKPVAPDELKAQQGRIIFNDLYPITNNGLGFYTGKDSIKKFTNDSYLYGKDSLATKRIDDLLFAEKVLTSAQVNEAATLSSGKTNATYKNLLKGFNQSDVPNRIQKAFKEFKLPAEANIKAGERFQQALNSSTDKAFNSVSPFKVEYFHPEEQKKKHEENKIVSYLQSNGSSNPQIMQTLKMIDKHGTQRQWEKAAELRGITALEAKKLYLKSLNQGQGK